MTPDLDQLRALATAIDAGTFDAAARRLHVTPSAISQRIRALENSVGSILITRSKPVRVTHVGVTYLALARKIDALTLDALAGAGSGEPLPLPIAVNGDSLATWVLPALAPLADDIRFTFHRPSFAFTSLYDEQPAPGVRLRSRYSSVVQSRV